MGKDLKEIIRNKIKGHEDMAESLQGSDIQISLEDAHELAADELHDILEYFYNGEE